MNLPKLETAIRGLLPDLTVEPVTVLGRAGAAGSYDPHPSSAAKLKTREACWWVPWPMVGTLDESQAVQAPIFLWGGETKVFPTMRIWVRNRPSSKNGDWEFYTLDDWLYSAVYEWTFPLALPKNETSSASFNSLYFRHLRENRSTAPGPLTVMRQLKSKQAELADADILRVLGNVIRFAIHGRTRSRADRLLSIRQQTGLTIPLRNSWLRPIAASQDEFTNAANNLHLRAARSQLLSGHLFRPDRSSATTERFNATTKALEEERGIPKLYKSLRKGIELRPDTILPAAIDLYHTPEDEKIRVCLHAADGARINSDRSLTGSKSNPHALSPATSQIPFAEYDDPRRLLLGAKAQVHAVELTHPEEPLVVTPHRKSAQHDPPGVNLRVGYLAWAGWNHEDAWVLSQSAADKLQQRTRWTQSIAVSALESKPIIRFQVGSDFEKDDPLIYRQCSPGLLRPALKRSQDLFRPYNGSLGGYYRLRAEEGDQARQDGRVTRIEVWDLTRGICRIDGPDGKVVEGPIPYDISEDAYRRYRAIYRFHLQQERPLEVGDKLANRHGHKGVVGLILPDERMPQWKGEPLEALIDPISVFNRRNWGQLYETLAGAVASELRLGACSAELYTGKQWLLEFRKQNPDSDERGASLVTAPECSPWFRDAPDHRFHAVAGSQFVLRMPQNAGDKLSADAASDSKRMVKFDPFSRFAMWAHSSSNNLGPPDTVDLSTTPSLCPAALDLRQQLWLAGVRLELPTAARKASSKKPESLVVRRSNLSILKDIPKGAKGVELEIPTSTNSMRQQLSRLEPGKLYYVKLPKARSNSARSRILPWKSIRWLPLVSYRDVQPHHVSRQVALASRLLGLGVACTRGRVVRDLQTPLRSLVKEALRTSVGANNENSKKSWIQSQVQSGYRNKSGRAVIAPSGLPAEERVDQIDTVFARAPLRIDEISLPVAIFRAVASSSTAPPHVWVKRDPVLHRWGLLPVYAHEHAENVIRLPASLLGALGADFDGDDAAVMGVEPYERDTAHASHPVRISLHDYFKTPMFKPGKQYVYGLHLLSTDSRNAELLQKFQNKLNDQGAPQWPSKRKPLGSEALDDWCKKAVMEVTDATWWSIVEEYALLALRVDPGMGLGIFSDLAELSSLSVIDSGAAKSECCEAEEKDQREMIEGILKGRSLGLFQREIDPISDIMAAAVPMKGQFGNEVRHLIWKTKTLNRETVRAAQSFTERLSQSVLSVKSVGKTLPRFDDYRKFLRPKCLIPDTPRRQSKVELGTPPEWVSELQSSAEIEQVRKILEKHGWPQGEIAPWCKWLFAPYKLLELLHPTEPDYMPGTTLKLPVDDVRVSEFFLSQRHNGT